MTRFGRRLAQFLKRAREIDVAARLRVSCELLSHIPANTRDLGWIANGRWLDKCTSGPAVGCYRALLPRLRSCGIVACGQQVLLRDSVVEGLCFDADKELPADTIPDVKSMWQTWYFVSRSCTGVDIESLRSSFRAIAELEREILVHLAASPLPLELNPRCRIGFGGYLLLLAAKRAHPLLRCCGDFPYAPHDGFWFFCDLVPGYLRAMEYAFNALDHVTVNDTDGAGNAGRNRT